MAVVSTKKNSPRGMRRWAYLPLVAVVAAGAVCAGAGVGSAQADANSGGMITWRVHNHTDKVLTSGTFSKWDSGHPQSFIGFTSLNPEEVQSGAYEAGSFLQLNNTQVYSLCYDGKDWAGVAGGTAGEKWRDVWVFSRGGKLFLNPEGAQDDRYLKQTGKAC
ncbi:hypothetical protein [Rhodococcus jostii]|uniref:hypothetical protein n=1 Tax=Rhodococcus jostii TaxID=132919 RepID=UPI003629E0B3